MPTYLLSLSLSVTYFYKTLTNPLFHRDSTYLIMQPRDRIEAAMQIKQQIQQ